jgi:hypothetical protein
MTSQQCRVVQLRKEILFKMDMTISFSVLVPLNTENPTLHTYAVRNDGKSLKATAHQLRQDMRQERQKLTSAS